VEDLRITFWNFKWCLWSASLGSRCPWSYIEVMRNNFKRNNCLSQRTSTTSVFK
jgi:hypothetical protein